ncbi:hypothetical protein Tco_0502083 [Tanacetum coccineum]
MTAHHNDWDTSAQRGESSRLITSSSPEIAALTRQIAKMNKTFLRMSQSNQQVNVVNLICETCCGPHHIPEFKPHVASLRDRICCYGKLQYERTGITRIGIKIVLIKTNFHQTPNFPSTDEILRQHMIASDAKFQLLANQMTKIEKAFNERPQGALLSNTIPNPREDIKVITTRSGITLAGPSVPSPNPSSSSKEVERDPETTMDQVHILSSGSTARVPYPVIQPAPASKSNEIPERNPHPPLIPYPSWLNKDKLQDKSNIQIHKFLQMFKILYFNISFAEALAQMPKYAKMLKDLLTNKEKLLELANTPLNENF